MHVYDFNLASSKSFVVMLTDKVGKALDILKIEDRLFRFTEMDVKQSDDGVDILMNDYVNSLEEIDVREDRSDEKLTREDMKVLRKYVRKINWLAVNTRPDLAIHALELAKKQKNVILKDLTSVNRIFKKVHET